MNVLELGLREYRYWITNAVVRWQNQNIELWFENAIVGQIVNCDLRSQGVNYRPPTVPCQDTASSKPHGRRWQLSYDDSISTTSTCLLYIIQCTSKARAVFYFKAHSYSSSHISPSEMIMCLQYNNNIWIASNTVLQLWCWIVTLKANWQYTCICLQRYWRQALKVKLHQSGGKCGVSS